MNKTAIIAVASFGVLILTGAGIAQAAGPQLGFGMMGRMHRPYVNSGWKQNLSDQRLDKNNFQRGSHMMNMNFGPYPEKLAVFLGLSEVGLYDAVHSGKSIEEIASLHGKTANDLKVFFEQQHQERIQNFSARLSEEVKNGTITQEQMDNYLTKVENLKGRQGMHGPRGFFRHMGSPLTSN